MLDERSVDSRYGRNNIVTEERLYRRHVLEQSPRDGCALTHKAVEKSVPGRGNGVSNGTEALSSLQNYGICK